MMTPTDFDRIAEAINYRRAAIRILSKDTVAGRAAQLERSMELDQVAYGIANAFTRDNVPFDRPRFLEKAGMAT